MKLFLPLFLCLASILPSTASSTEWQLRTGDAPLSVAELEALPGTYFRFYDDGEAFFGTEGAYAYTYAPANGGGTAWGSYRISADGGVCVDFVNGAQRCDLYVRNGARLMLITAEGERYPIRN